MEEEIFHSALSRACFALSVGALLEGCIYSYQYILAILAHICHPNFTATLALFKAALSALSFSMVKTFDCVKCGGHHARPINRNCKNMENNKPMDTNTQILNELKILGGRMSQMESRMDSLSSKSSSPSRTSSRSESAERSLATTPEVRTQTTRDSASSLEEDLVLPTLDTLQHSRSIQDQVDTRIRELQAVNKEKGKFKSQRGGSETIWVKNEIAWPHNFVLSGNKK